MKMNAQVGIGNTSPNSNSLLEIGDATTTTKGLLLPRVNLTATSNPTPLSAHVQGMVVYNKNTAGDVTPGFYYNDGSAWIRLGSGSSSDDWTILGNSNATPGTNFLGTINNVDIRIKTFNTDRFNFTADGSLRSYGLGTSSLPTYSWNTDPNTGMFSPGADKLGITTGGLERMTIDNVGAVGINNTSPNANAYLEIGTAIGNTKGLLLPRVALSATTNFSPLSAHVAGMTVYNTATAGVGGTAVTPGFYYNDGTKWVLLSSKTPEPQVKSVSLTTDQIISGTTFTAVPGMSLTFIAEKTEALVNLTISGLGYTGSLTFGTFRLYNSTTATVIGGTNTSAQSLWKNGPSTYSITTWSCVFSKLLTGLTIGSSYTIILQGKTDNLLGTDGVAIYPASMPNSSHATISIIQ
jgi:hypothetical protein